ncbi:hypothetical protein ACFPK1_16495 [Actinomycetospora rhizophila]|uniref:DUF3040 family protein n=1 Tax=Actinomycetospora rhizophila TaxID=1416876 RepID=A0ABV9ZFR5_9PSEU
MTTTAGEPATRRAGPEQAAPAAPAPDDERFADVFDRGLRRGAAMVGQVQDRLPANPVPVYLGITALAVTGLVSWPVAVAAGCGYAAFRHWEPQPSGTPHPVPPID